MRFPYIILIGIAVVSVWMLNGRYYQEELTLFGFAETKETEINLNFSVMVDELNVLSGQSVKEGQLLLRAKRLDSDIKFEDQEMKISEINAKKRIWRSEQEGKLKTLESSYLKKMGEVNTQIDAINNIKDSDPSTEDNILSARSTRINKRPDRSARTRNGITEYHDFREEEISLSLAVLNKRHISG